jgi:hypothetical protein
MDSFLLTTVKPFCHPSTAQQLNSWMGAIDTSIAKVFTCTSLPSNFRDKEGGKGLSTTSLSKEYCKRLPYINIQSHPCPYRGAVMARNQVHNHGTTRILATESPTYIQGT